MFFIERTLREHRVEPRERVLDVATTGRCAAVFVQLGCVNVQVNNRAVLAKFLELAGHAVVEPHAEGEQQIRAVLELHHRLVGVVALFVFAVDGPVGKGRAVHAQPAQRQRMRLRKTADAHERGRHGNLCGLGEFFEFRRRAAADDAAAAINHRAFGFFNQPHDFVQRHFVGAQVRLVVTAQTFLDLLEGRPHRLGPGLLHVLRHVNDHRAGAAGLGKVKRLLHNARDVVDTRDEIGMLHDGQRHADDVGFLKCAAADHGLVDLAGDGHERAGIEVGIGDGGDEIGGAGAAGAHAHAGLAGGAGVTFRRETAALFMARQDGADFGFRERLVDFHARAAGIGKNDLDPFAFEGLDEDVASGHGRADLGARGGGGFLFLSRRSRFCGGGGSSIFSCLAHVFFWLRPVARIK